MCDYILRVTDRAGRVFQTIELDRDEAIALAAEARRHGDSATVQRDCQGHPASTHGAMGCTEYCDGTCQPVIDS